MQRPVRHVAAIMTESAQSLPALPAPHVPLEVRALEASRLDLAVARATGWTRRQSQRAIEAGQVYVAGRRCREPGSRVEQGEALRVHAEGPDRSQLGGGGVTVVHECADWLVLDKPAGLPCQPEPGGGDALSLRAGKHLGQAVADVHRLDREVSGLVLWGKHPDATAAAAAQFRDHKAQRRYLAVVRGRYLPKAETIDAAIGEDDAGRPALSPTGRPARTHTQLLFADDAAGLGLVALALETGRSHQLRLHLSHSQGAVVGDGRHGDLHGRSWTAPPRIALHAALLRWRGLDGRWLQAAAAPPEDFWPPATNSSWLPDDWQNRLLAMPPAPAKSNP